MFIISNNGDRSLLQRLSDDEEAMRSLSVGDVVQIQYDKGECVAMGCKTAGWIDMGLFGNGKEVC